MILRSLTQDERDELSERQYREAVQGEIDDEAAQALYHAAKVALARGGLDAVAEFALRDAVAKAEEF